MKQNCHTCQKQIEGGTYMDVNETRLYFGSGECLEHYRELKRKELENERKI